MKLSLFLLNFELGIYSLIFLALGQFFSDSILILEAKASASAAVGRTFCSLIASFYNWTVDELALSVMPTVSALFYCFSNKLF